MDARPLPTEALEDTTLLFFPGLRARRELVHAITTRPWNMAPHRGPQREHAVERRRRVCAHLGLEFERLTAADQIHSHHVVRVEPRDVGAGRLGRDGAVRFVDGLACDLPGVPIMQLSADCPLILLFDPDRPAIGAAHASWRGTVARIAEQLVQTMVREFGSAPPRLRAGLCPCAGPQRYEIGEDVLRIARGLLPEAERFFPRAGGRLYFDLRAANFDQLVRCGVHPAHIEVAAECTLGDERFYSHRRDGEQTGRFALIAAIRGPA